MFFDVGAVVRNGEIETMNKREWMLQAALAGMRSGRLMEPLDLSVQHLSGVYDAIVAATPGPADEGWIEHRGEKPYPEGWVRVKFRDDRLASGDADTFIWTNDGEPEDIVAWHPI